MDHIIDESGRLQVSRGPDTPLVFTACWGNDSNFEALGLWLSALRRFGRYRGTVGVFTDRDASRTLSYAEPADRELVICRPFNGHPWIQRYQGWRDQTLQFSPILYLDTDIVVDADLEPTLRRVAAARGICVTTEREIDRWAWTIAVRDIPIEHHPGDWFGLSLLKNDPECLDELLPLINSGIIGCSDNKLFEDIGDIVRKLFLCHHHQEIGRVYGDQPFLNYVLTKIRVSDTESLLGTCQFSGSVNDFPMKPRGFVHFCWTQGVDKVIQMRSYMENVKEFYKGGSVSCRFVRNS